MIDIAMLACNRARVTETSIRELAARTTTPHRLTVLDNGSVDDTPAMLTQLYKENIVDKLILHPENYGVHWGHNRLLEEVESELYVCADNDLIPHAPIDGADWLSRLLALMFKYKYREYAAIACRPHVMIGDNADRMFADARHRTAGAHRRSPAVDAYRRRARGGWLAEAGQAVT